MLRFVVVVLKLQGKVHCKMKWIPSLDKYGTIGTPKTKLRLSNGPKASKVRRFTDEFSNAWTELKMEI